MAKVLLVDDDRTNSSLTKMLLELDGFTVMVAPDIARAQSAMATGVDILLIDCNLSRGDDGVDLLRMIRTGETAAASNIPIIMTSGDDRRARDANSGGANIFLLKPYPPSKLSDEITILLAEDKSRG
jgi:two-component system, OmpR family, phosphate regulon response regulator PhoB